MNGLALIDFWVVFGLAAQFCFFLRFFTQWIASERKRRSVIPTYFWYFSLLGGLGLFIYALHIMDIVFILGQGMGLIIYLRNIILIHGEKHKKMDKPNSEIAP